MRKLITITSRGQTTLPAEFRRKLGVARSGGRLSVNFNEKTGQLIISKPITIAELRERTSQHIKSGTPPVRDVDAYYQTHRVGRQAL